MTGERSPEALPVTELTPEKLTAKYEREFSQHLDTVGIPENHPDAEEELRMRTEMEAQLNRALELTQLPNSGSIIRQQFEAMEKLYQKRMKLRSEFLNEALRNDLGIEGEKKPGATLANESEKAFGVGRDNDGRKAAGEKIKTIAERIDGGKDAFMQGGNVDAKELAKAQKELEELKNSPVTITTEQQEAIARTETALARIADIDPVAVNYHRQELESKKAPFSSLGGRYLRFFGLIGTSIFAAWAVVAKNPKMAAAYGAAAYLIWKPETLSSADKKLATKMEYLAKPKTMDLLSRTQGGPKWSEAVAALFAIEEGKNEKQLGAIKSLLRERKGISLTQASEIVGANPQKNAFYRKMEAAGSDEERLEILQTFSRRGGGERGRATIEYLKARE